MKKYFPVLQYINIPNTFTTLGLVFGVVAIYFMTQGSLKGVLICLLLASLMDLVDGYFAVKLNQQTRFGEYADSLVDFFICCIMPVVIVYYFVANDLLIIISLLFYSICGLWRLAHFNVVASEKRNYFTGLPVPGAMLLVAIAIWAVVQYGLPAWLCVAAFFITGLLMISFFKIKKFGVGHKVLCAVDVGFFILIVLS